MSDLPLLAESSDDAPPGLLASKLFASESGDLVGEIVLLWLVPADDSLFSRGTAFAVGPWLAGVDSEPSSAWADDPPIAGTTLRASRAEATTAPPSLRKERDRRLTALRSNHRFPVRTDTPTALFRTCTRRATANSPRQPGRVHPYEKAHLDLPWSASTTAWTLVCRSLDFCLNRWICPPYMGHLRPTSFLADLRSHDHLVRFGTRADTSRPAGHQGGPLGANTTGARRTSHEMAAHRSTCQLSAGRNR